MIEISTPYEGKVVLDERGFPLTNRPGHGIGTRSIMAFAEKYDALCLSSLLDLFQMQHLHYLPFKVSEQNAS